MDCNKCLICQEKTTERLKCPLNAQGSRGKSEPYSSFLNNVSAFRVLGTFPVVINFGEDMTVDELVETGVYGTNLAMSSSAKRSWIELTKIETESSTTGDERPRRQSMERMACLFCRRENGHLHEFRTLETGEIIRKLATELQETELTARMEGGDISTTESPQITGTAT